MSHGGHRRGRDPHFRPKCGGRTQKAKSVVVTSSCRRSLPGVEVTVDLPSAEAITPVVAVLTLPTRPGAQGGHIRAQHDSDLRTRAVP